MSQRQGPWLLQFWADGTGTLLVLEGNYIEKEEIDLNSVVLVFFFFLFLFFFCFFFLFFFFFCFCFFVFFFVLFFLGGFIFLFSFIYLSIYFFFQKTDFNMSKPVFWKQRKVLQNFVC